MSRNITEFLNSKSESVKLKAEQVKLGVADDILKGIGNAEALLAEAKAFKDKEDKAWAEVKKLEDLVVKQEGVAGKVSEAAPKIGSKMDKLANSMLTTYNKAESAAKDLGVPLSTIAGLSKFESVFDELETVAKGLNAKIR
tara:strand:+ start:177 stop:599 length:423 start_codon:yes stop_codon:yes gene_type:complete